MNSKTIIGALLVLVSALVVALAIVSGKESNASSASPKISVVTPTDAPTWPSGTVDASNEGIQEDIVTVANPFGDMDSAGMVLSTSAEKPFTDLVATMAYDMTSPTPNTIEGDFGGTIMGNSSITSYEPVSIVHILRYATDSVVDWTPAQGDNFSWNQKPSRETVPFGSVVTVTYSTKDASGVWTGNIQIERPKN